MENKTKWINISNITKMKLIIYNTIDNFVNNFI